MISVSTKMNTQVGAKIEHGKNGVWRQADKHLWKTVAVFLCTLLILTVVSLKAVVLCHAYFIGCRWYLLSIHICFFESSLSFNLFHSTSCHGWGISKWHCRRPRIVILLFVCVMWDGIRLLIFGSKEIHKIKQEIKVCLVHVRAFPQTVYPSVRRSVCTLFALVHVFACRYSTQVPARVCVRVCVRIHTSKSHIWLQIKWCMKEGNDREGKWWFFNVTYPLSNPNIRPTKHTE